MRSGVTWRPFIYYAECARVRFAHERLEVKLRALNVGLSGWLGAITLTGLLTAVTVAAGLWLPYCGFRALRNDRQVAEIRQCVRPRRDALVAQRYFAGTMFGVATLQTGAGIAQHTAKV